MKVLIINGSPRFHGNSSRLKDELISIFEKEGIETDLYEIGSKDIRGCMACGYCYQHGECVFKDDVNDLAKRFEAADGLIVISPVYYGSANGSVISLLDRLFYSSHIDKRFKVGAAFAIARRAGTTATFDELNKYFTISQMPVASGRYWNNGFGRTEGQIEKDEEGLQNTSVVARNMVFLMKAIKDAKEKYGLPET
ncbi:MAG: flavodoxin family protein, partial [Bacilli bacterium]|nr:flavodoxin family protein [Bacilli bacterium]